MAHHRPRGTRSGQGFRPARVAAEAARRPLFHPVLNEDYAVRVIREWNPPREGEGHVTLFRVESSLPSRYPVRQAGGRTILELWASVAESAEFNAHVHGTIEPV